MTDSQLHNAIRDRFEAYVAGGGNVPVVYDNDPKAPPSGGALWCRCTIQRNETIQVESGPASYRRHGRVDAQLFGPLTRGDGPLLELADGIVSAFEGVTAAGVRYGAVTVRPIGVRGQEYQVNVEIPFTA